MVDGAEQPTSNYLSNAFTEVAPYLMLDGHMLGVMQLIIADFRWNQLSEGEQGWIMEAARYAAQVSRSKVAEIEEKTFAQLRERGVTIVDVPDKAPWVEACQPTIQKHTATQRDVYRQILDMQ